MVAAEVQHAIRHAAEPLVAWGFVRHCYSLPIDPLSFPVAVALNYPVVFAERSPRGGFFLQRGRLIYVQNCVNVQRSIVTSTDRVRAGKQRWRLAQTRLTTT
jgi:hypothetical protein